MSGAARHGFVADDGGVIMILGAVGGDAAFLVSIKDGDPGRAVVSLTESRMRTATARSSPAPAPR
jgi:hypothetical protein